LKRVTRLIARAAAIGRRIPAGKRVPRLRQTARVVRYRDDGIVVCRDGSWLRAAVMAIAGIRDGVLIDEPAGIQRYVPGNGRGKIKRHGQVSIRVPAGEGMADPRRCSRLV